MFERTKARAYNMMDLALELAGGLLIIALGIGYVAAPIFFTVNNTSTASWDVTSRTIWPYLFLLSIVTVLFGLLYVAKSKRAD
jgi:ABC-type antimicrobial peptide transport system permease subunit